MYVLAAGVSLIEVLRARSDGAPLTPGGSVMIFSENMVSIDMAMCGVGLLKTQLFAVEYSSGTGGVRLNREIDADNGDAESCGEGLGTVDK